MSLPTTAPDADLLLKREVALPAFFEKVAAAGATPGDAAAAERLLNVGDVVAETVTRRVTKWAQAGLLDHADPVKSACDAALAAAGVTAAAVPKPAGYADLPGVKAAAELLAKAAAAPVTTETPAAPAGEK